MNDKSESSTVKLKLNEREFTFDDGKWHGENVTTDTHTLLKEKQDLIEENNYLKLKVEILLNMLAEASSIQKSCDHIK
ncbi:uncharacterized protein NPIL_562211 [Nephila pilipes]|uniref:Uncharacterized protein n=1 Tax=Nephila pilipes TaxID=299642 RepID=A0A8X6N9W4_NEPPI|nr:uncharacterized protein NPIL_562211 [Nephila pilipes]